MNRRNRSTELGKSPRKDPGCGFPGDSRHPGRSRWWLGHNQRPLQSILSLKNFVSVSRKACRWSGGGRSRLWRCSSGGGRESGGQVVVQSQDAPQKFAGVSEPSGCCVCTGEHIHTYKHSHTHTCMRVHIEIIQPIDVCSNFACECTHSNPLSIAGGVCDGAELGPAETLRELQGAQRQVSSARTHPHPQTHTCTPHPQSWT